MLKFYEKNFALITFGVLKMKYKKIILFFCIILPLSIFLRTFQLFFTVETNTGFFKREYETAGFYLLILIIAVCASLAIICFTGHRNPEHPPKINPLISFASGFALLGIAAGVYIARLTPVIMPWQILLLTVSGVLAAVYFLLYAISSFIDLKLPPLLSVLPSVYFIMKIICSFTTVSSLALISDNILILSALCVMLLFFLSFAKLYNGIDTERNFRKLMASGLVSTVLCFTQSIPHIIINLITDNGYLHTSNVDNFSVLSFGIFIAVFIFSHFSAKNIRFVRSHRASDTTDEGFCSE